MKRQPCNIIVTLLLIAAIFSITAGYIPAQSYKGQNKAEIIIDPSNKQNISGFANICYTYTDRTSKTLDVRRGLINLREAMLKWTKIDTRLDKPLPISSPNIMQMPFIYIAFDSGLDLTEPEKKNVNEYLINGGFMVIENVNPTLEINVSDSMFKKVFQGVMEKGGRFAPIFNDHPIYSSFFDFTDGPPRGDETNMVEVRSLEGLFIGNRLAALYSNKRYVNKWIQETNNDPQLKMGVNMLVFALKQQGGIAKVTR